MHIDELIHRKPEEKVIFFLRRHPIILVGESLLIVLILLIPIAGWFFVDYFWPTILIGEITGPSIRLFLSAYYLCGWLLLYSNVVDYYLDAWVVTNDRILNIEQAGLFNRTVSELDLMNIQDITSEVKGVLPFFFGYGNIYVQTAAEQGRFIFEQIPRAEEVRKRLLILVEEEQKNMRSVNPKSEFIKTTD